MPSPRSLPRTLALSVLGTLLATSVPAAAVAQLAPARVERLASDVYAVIRKYPQEDPSDANSTIIVNEHDVIVVDANITPSSSRMVIDEIRRLTPKPVRYVITTHAHSDHHYGNQAYRDAYPGVEFIGSAATREDVIAEDIPALEKNLGTEYPAEIARYKAALARGTRENGTPYTPEEKKDVAHQLMVLEWFVREGKAIRQIPPTITVADSMVLHRGDRSIVIRHPGRANTRGDLIVYLPRERILATGDIVVSPVPYAFGSFLGEWVAVLRGLRGYPVEVIVPGHGDVQRDWKYVDGLAELFEQTLVRVRAAGTDVPLDRVLETVSLADHRARFAGSDPSLARAFDDLVPVMVERAYLEVRGKLPPAP